MENTIKMTFFKVMCKFYFYYPKTENLSTVEWANKW